jgi:hypothetical protein
LVSTSIFGPTNPGVTSWGSLVDYFLVIIYSVSMTITESTGTGCKDKSRLQLCRQSRWLFLSRPPTLFSVTLTESTGTVRADETKHQRWRKSRWWFLSWQRLCFCFRFRSLLGIFGPTNPGVTSWGSLVDYFWVIIHFVSVMITESTGTGCTNKSRLQLCRQSHWLFLSHSQLCFLMTITESTGTVRADETKHQRWRKSRWWFLSWQRLCFRFWFWCLLVYLGWQIQASHLEVVWLIIS